jgi:putative chitinase
MGLAGDRLRHCRSHRHGGDRGPLKGTDMTTMVTLAQLGAVMRRASAQGYLDAWVAPLNAAMLEFGVTTPLRAAYFVANAAHETRELSALEENLNYTAERLVQVWPGHFAAGNGSPNALARQLAGRPEALANYVYDDAHRSPRYRLGNTQPGDGWRYRGVSATHLTGRANIVPCLRALGRDAADTDYLRTPEGAARGAGWYWRQKKLWLWADVDDVQGFRAAVQGGAEGLESFAGYLDHAKVALLGPPAGWRPAGRLLMQGMRGDDVAEAQSALGRRGVYRGRVDGIFGGMTDEAVRAFQAQHPPLDVDGKVGAATRRALGI